MSTEWLDYENEPAKYLHMTLPLGWDGGGWVVGDAVGGHRRSNGTVVFLKRSKCYNQEVLSDSLILFTIAINERNCFDMQHLSFQ